MVLALLLSYELFLWSVSFTTELISCFSSFLNYHQYQNSEQRVNPEKQFTKLTNFCEGNVYGSVWISV